MSEELNPGHWHEACDRTHCVEGIIHTMLLDHPAICSVPSIREKIEEALKLIGQVYQECGARM